MGDYLVARWLRRPDGVRVKRYVEYYVGTYLRFTSKQCKARRYDFYGACRAVHDLAQYPHHIYAHRVRLVRRRAVA